jgi:hypothetical protein
MDLRPLNREKTFTLNRGYLLYDRIGGAAYHVVVNPLVAEQWAWEIQSLAAIKFSAWGLRRRFARRPEMIYVGGPSRSKTPRFSPDITRDIWPGATVTYVAMQIAFYLGFQQVVLIGVDHRFLAPGRPHQEVIQGGETNRFDPNYAEGDPWDHGPSLPAPIGCPQAYERDGGGLMRRWAGR